MGGLNFVLTLIPSYLQSPPSASLSPGFLHYNERPERLCVETFCVYPADVYCLLSGDSAPLEMFNAAYKENIVLWPSINSFFGCQCLM